MKLVVEIAPTLLDRVRAAVERGNFRSLTEFASLAMENQLALELDQTADDSNRDGSASPVVQSTHAPIERAPYGEILGPTIAASLSVNDHGWLWGIVNRVLPIKFAARYLQNATDGGLVPLESAKREAANQAEQLARRIVASTSKDRDRHDRLVTGFPLREPIYPAKLRFANHYVGRLEHSKEPRGALFELGLASLGDRGGKWYVGLTPIGEEFARLRNPVLDSANHQTPLSPEEIACYVTKIVPGIPRELDCFLTLLTNIGSGPKSVDQLDRLVELHLPRKYSKAALQTQKAGALGRLRDLGLIERIKEGLTASFTITPAGKKAFEHLAQLPVDGGENPP